MQQSPLDNFIQYQARDRTEWGQSERVAYYSLMRAYYLNYAYQSAQIGGYKEYISSQYGRAVANLFAGIFNPAKRVVDIYKHIFSGAFGDEIQIDSANDLVAPALNKVWQWGNINIERQIMLFEGPLFGTVGIRTVARSLPTPRVYNRFDSAEKIKYITYDDRGNVETAVIEYIRNESTLHGTRDNHVITEILAPDEFSTLRDGIPYDLINNRANGELSKYENVLGVTPYVILKHKHTGLDWGLGALAGEESKIDLLNMLIGHIITQIIRHVKVKWLMAASGNPPKDIDLGDTSVAYIKTDPTVTTAPIMLPMVANLSLGDAISMASMMLDELRDSLPELKATDGKFLSGQSGETVAQLRQPAEQLIIDARGNYEDALIRAQKISLSWGIRLGLWNLGTGTGTKAAAESAYINGLEDHKFNTRPALPLTVYQQLELETKRLANKKIIADTIDTLTRAQTISPVQKLAMLYPEYSQDELSEELAAIQASALGNPEVLAFDEGSPQGEIDASE